jgi:hypothetical protein
MGQYIHYNQFPSVNYYMLSGLSHFLGRVFTINNYFTKYEYSVTVNDVNMQWTYLGKILHLLVNFPVLQFDEDVEDPNLDWGEDDYERFDEENNRSSARRRVMASQN